MPLSPASCASSATRSNWVTSAASDSTPRGLTLEPRPILESLSKLRKPVYLEIEPATSAITRLLIPHVTHVVGVQPSEVLDLDVDLDNSHARHVLPRRAPDSAEFERELREAMQERMWS